MPKKKVLALLSGVAAIAFGVAAVLTSGNPLPVLGATCAAVAALVWGMKALTPRNALIVVAASVGSGFLFFHFDNFWGVFVAVLTIVWAAFSLLPFMDSGWRLKVGFVASAFVGAVIALWPTIDGFLPSSSEASVTGGSALERAVRTVGSHLHCPQYIKDNVSFAIAPGLDLSGGLRLVYTVEVDEAIRDKRDHFADEMRQELATAFALHSGEGRVTREELGGLEAKVHVSQPETALIRLTFKDKNDKAKVDERFAKKFLAELGETPGSRAEAKAA